MTNNWRSKRTFLSLSLSDNQTNKLQNIIIHNMNNIQVSLKADNQNGILSIQGVDLFSIIDTDWNWNNISFIQDSCVRAFFIRAKKLLNNNIAEEEEDNQVFNDASKNSEEINSYYEKEFGYSEWILPETEDYDPSDETEINYAVDDLDRTEINLSIPYYKIIWHESIYQYIYDNLNLWAYKIEEDIKVYKELCNIIDNIPTIISTIKHKNSTPKAILSLMQKFNISKQTAETIVNMKLYILSTLTVGDCENTLQYKEELRRTITKLITLKRKITETYKANEKIKK